MSYNIISTGSKGNAVQMDGYLLIDCGVPFKALSDCYMDLKLVLLTHEHKDHINKTTIKRLAKERPTLRFACCEWMLPHLYGIVGLKQIDLLTIDTWYDYGTLKLSPIELYHDVPNCGYRLDFDGHRVFYATDTGTLDGIEAKEYDLYMVEANHKQTELEAKVKEKQEKGEFCYELRAFENHLSQEQAEDWIYQNIGLNGKYIFMHQHSD